MRRRLRISSAAWSQIERASLWWKRYRDKAPHAFDEDLEKAFEEIRSSPSIGTRVHARNFGVRSVWLERIGYFLYYRVVDDVVIVIAIWHAARGSRPKL